MSSLLSGKQLIKAAEGCRNYELLAACPLSCAHWLSTTDMLSLNPDAQPHGPLRAPPGWCGGVAVAVSMLMMHIRAPHDAEFASWRDSSSFRASLPPNSHDDHLTQPRECFVRAPHRHHDTREGGHERELCFVGEERCEPGTSLSQRRFLLALTLRAPLPPQASATRTACICPTTAPSRAHR